MLDELIEITLNVGNSFFPSETVRKLKATWTREAQEDVRVVHNLEAEMELANIMAREIRAEVDENILHDLRIQQMAQRLPRLQFKKEELRPVNWCLEGF